MNKIFNMLQMKFTNAFRGFITSFKEESSLVLHLISSLVVVMFGVYSQLEAIEWAIITLVISLVIGFEILNTGIENLVDLISFQYNIQAKKVKDVGAAATMINAIAAIIIGALIIIPKFLERINEL